MDKNKLDSSLYLIKTAAFYSISLEELEGKINANGYIEGYSHGENNSGNKQSEDVKTHLAMAKNFTTIMKTLTDMCPPKPRAKSKLQSLRDE